MTKRNFGFSAPEEKPAYCPPFTLLVASGLLWAVIIAAWMVLR